MGRMMAWLELAAVAAVVLPWTASGYQLFCWPSLWEGRAWTLHVTHTDQGSEVSETTAEISVDLIGQRYATRETGHRDGHPFSVFYLYYYPANTLYRVEDGKCETSALHGNFSAKCVTIPDPDVLEYLKESLGFENGVITNGERGLRNGEEYFYSVDGYIPLMEERHGEVNGVAGYTLTNYFNVTTGIRDPSVFTPPASCIQ